MPEPTAVPDPAELEQQIHASLDSLLAALTLEPLGDDRFRATSERGRFDRLFGGQQLGQAFMAASLTVEGKDPHSLHAYFVEGGTPEEPIDLVVERVRDGRSMSTRRVTLQQGSRTLLTAIASFHANPDSPAMDSPRPDAPHPDDLPRLQEWVHGMPDERRPFGMTWVDVPPPLDMRIGEPPTFLGG
ncbi:MAG: thioesterase family protein, partial [Acidimicrobiia bacterium]